MGVDQIVIEERDASVTARIVEAEVEADGSVVGQFERLREQLLEVVERNLALAESALAAFVDRRAELEAEVKRWRAELKRLDPSAPAPSSRSSSAGGSFACEVPGCGRSFEKEHGLTMHMRRTHAPTPTETPTAPPAPSPRPNDSSAGGLDPLEGASETGPLWCDDCDAGFELATHMDRHTRRAHRRAPYRQERTPRKADR